MWSLKSPIIQPGSGRSQREAIGWAGTQRRKAILENGAEDSRGCRIRSWEVLRIILSPHPGPCPVMAERLPRLGGIWAPEAPHVPQEEPALPNGARSPHLPAGNLGNLGRGLGPRELWSELRGRNMSGGHSAGPPIPWVSELVS